MRLLLSVCGRKAERAACLVRLSWPAARACCPALCRCFISTLRFFGSSSPVTFLLLFSTFHHAVTFFRYVPFLPLFVMFLLLVTFLLKREPIPLYSPYSLLSIYPPYSPPFLPFFPFSPCSPLLGCFPWFSGGFRAVPAVLVRSGRSWERRLLHLPIGSGPGVGPAFFGCSSCPSRWSLRGPLRLPALLRLSVVLLSVFPCLSFSRARGGADRRQSAQKSGAAALVRRRRSGACILFSGCKGQDDYCGADQAINSCSHVFPVSVK